MRYVLKRHVSTPAGGSRPQDLPGLDLIEQTGDDLLLVEAEPEAMERHRDALADWTAAPEVTYGLPGLKRELPEG